MKKVILLAAVVLGMMSCTEEKSGTENETSITEVDVNYEDTEDYIRYTFKGVNGKEEPTDVVVTVSKDGVTSDEYIAMIFDKNISTAIAKARYRCKNRLTWIPQKVFVNKFQETIYFSVEGQASNSFNVPQEVDFRFSLDEVLSLRKQVEVDLSKY